MGIRCVGERRSMRRRRTDERRKSKRDVDVRYVFATGKYFIGFRYMSSLSKYTHNSGYLTNQKVELL